MIKLIYSKDDKGYYYQNLTNWKISQLFSTDLKASKALKANKLIWKD